MSQRIRLFDAALPLVTAALMLVGAVLLHSTRFYYPLGAGALVAAVIAYRAGYSLKGLTRACWDGMKSTLIALSILVLVGGLIGVWKESGTVPAMVYYGLGMASPRLLVPAAFVLSVAVSMMLGTSLGTLSTLGVAVMGVAHGVGAPLPLVAGALVSGALFGDRSSPLSGSLNLNVAMTGTELRPVMAGLMPTGLIAAGISLVGYLVLGLGPEGAVGGTGSALREAIGSQFAIRPWLLLPPVAVLVLAFLRVPVRWALGFGMLAGAVLSLTNGGSDLLAPARAALMGFTPHTGDGALDRILAGGGVFPMIHQVILILTAGAFNGIMEATGMMSLVISRLVEGLRRPLSLTLATMLVSTAVALVAANQALAIIVSGRMLRPSYDRLGLPAAQLSRALADSGTVLAGLIPWNLMGMLAGATLGLPVRSWAVFGFFGWLLPLVSLAYSAMEERRGLMRETAHQTAS